MCSVHIPSFSSIMPWHSTGSLSFISWSFSSFGRSISVIIVLGIHERGLQISGQNSQNGCLEKNMGKPPVHIQPKKLRNQRLYVQNRSRKNQASKQWFLLTFFQGHWPIVCLGWRAAVLCGWTYLFVAIGMSNTICSALSLGLHGTHHSTGSCVCIIWTCFFEKPRSFHVHTFMRIPKTSTISLALTSTSKLTMIPPKHTHKRHRHGSSLNLCWCGRRRIMNFLCLQTLILGSMLQGSLNWQYKMNTGDLIPTKWYGLWTPVSTFPSLSTTTYSRLLWKSKDV